MTQTLSRFAKYAWFVVGFNVLVILWGAVVRATGSGAGCGSHWPACNGDIVHVPQTIETFIELFHRLTSAFDGLLVIVLVIWAFRAFAKGHPTRVWSVLSLVFILIEGGLGAMLVRLELTGDNASVLRAVVVGVHLVNTLLLLLMVTMTAWFASGGKPFSLRGQGSTALWLGLALLGVLVIGSTGAVTALGDTLFPAESLIDGLRQDMDPTANFLIRLRVIHPLIAVGVTLYAGVLVGVLTFTRPAPVVKRLGQWLVGIFFFQLLVGVVNVVLLAPVWMQVVHLLVADVVWIVLLMFSAATLAEPDAARVQAAPVTGD